MAIPFQLADNSTETRCITKRPMHENNCRPRNAIRPRRPSHPWLRHNNSSIHLYIGPSTESSINDMGRPERGLLDHGVGWIRGITYEGVDSPRLPGVHAKRKWNVGSTFAPCWSSARVRCCGCW